MSTLAVFHALPEKRDTSYEPNYEFPGKVIGDRHAAAPALVADVDGWLLDEDALKLYELAYFTRGPVLEIGAYHGKSSIVMARAIQDAGRPTFVVSLDVDIEALGTARRNAERVGVSPTILYVHGTPMTLRHAMGGLAPQLTFVDGLHTYDGVAQDLRALEPIVPAGGIIVFHDYLEDHADERPEWYRVFEAVRDSWVRRDCEFAGTAGGCGVFRRRSGGPSATDARASLLRLPNGGREALLHGVEAFRRRLEARLRRR